MLCHLINFHPIHHTFATAGSDGAFNFWDKDSKQWLKAMSRCGQPIPCSTFNNDGSIFAYLVCYDWSNGAENHNPATAKTYIYLHLPQVRLLFCSYTTINSVSLISQFLRIANNPISSKIYFENISKNHSKYVGSSSTKQKINGPTTTIK